MVSIRRTDLCAFERDRPHDGAGYVGRVSIRRTDLCAFEHHDKLATVLRLLVMFQSVERICVPSNGIEAIGQRLLLKVFQSVERICVPSNRLKDIKFGRIRVVSIRRTDLCAFERRSCVPRWPSWNSFNPSNGFVCLRTSMCTMQGWRCVVSIRRTDLCAFEHIGSFKAYLAALSFNPSNGFVCLRTVPCAGDRLFANGFNPSNGFVCLRTCLSAAPRPRGSGFNPSNGFVCLRTLKPLAVAS